MWPTWERFYHGDLQGALEPHRRAGAVPRSSGPGCVRGRAGADPRAARFVRAWATRFALETIVDPLAIVLVGLPMLPFVLLGDFRVFLLVLGVMEPDRPLAGTFARAAAWTLVVPVDRAGRLYRLAIALAGPLPEQVLWLIYEMRLRRRWRSGGERACVPARRPLAHRYLRAVLAYVAVVLRALGAGRRAHPRGLRRGLGAARDPEPALLRVLGAGRLGAVLLAAVRLDQQRRSRRAGSAARARASARRGSPTTPSGALARRSG